MNKKMKTSQKTYYVPVSVQKLFTYTIGLLYSAQVIFIAWSTMTQAFDGSDYRPQLGYLFSYLLLPVFAFLIAYALNPRKLAFLSRSFESLLITISGYIAWSIVMMFWPMLFLGSFLFDDYRLFDYILPTVFLVIFSSGLLLLRIKRIWK